MSSPPISESKRMAWPFAASGRGDLRRTPGAVRPLRLRFPPSLSIRPLEGDEAGQGLAYLSGSETHSTGIPPGSEETAGSDGANFVWRRSPALQVLLPGSLAGERTTHAAGRVFPSTSPAGTGTTTRFPSVNSFCCSTNSSTLPFAELLLEKREDFPPRPIPRFPQSGYGGGPLPKRK